MKIGIETKNNPKLCQRELSDGRISLYLEYYLGRTQEPVLDENGNQVYYENTNRPKYRIAHTRKKESLDIYLYQRPKNLQERASNKQNIELANTIRSMREQELRAGKIGYRFEIKDVNFYDYIEAYIEKYKKADIRVMKGASARWKSFIEESYPILSRVINPRQMDSRMMEKFSEYLVQHSRGEGARSYFRHFKKILTSAVKDHILESNPCDGISCGTTDDTIKKDILTQDEMKQLLLTRYEGQNNEIYRAFAFCLYTGIRYVDIKLSVKYNCIDESMGIIKFDQHKTKDHSSASTVIIPLNETILSLIGEIPEDKDRLIFNLPSHTMCLKALRSWTKKAGIKKHITWHCARHSFATNILQNGANPKVTAELLGQSSIKYIDRYTRAIDAAKIAAINSLPTLESIKKDPRDSNNSQV